MYITGIKKNLNYAKWDQKKVRSTLNRLRLYALFINRIKLLPMTSESIKTWH